MLEEAPDREPDPTLEADGKVARGRWMERARRGEWNAVRANLSVYGELGLQEDPRGGEAYADQVITALGLRDAGRRPHLTAADRAAAEEVFTRKAMAFWIDGSPRTIIRGVMHDTVTVGGPVRGPPMRLKGLEAQLVEDGLREEVSRGQLVRGNSPWGSWAFPVAAHPAGKKRRIVVDYRRVNSRTVRAVYYLRTADTVKGECAGSVYFSLLDAVAGFNQLRNSARAQLVLAVLASSGCYLPRCLNFGPTNGPEDFARVVDTLFALGKSRVRRLNREWNVYVDDFCVRTGRWRGNRGYSDAEYGRMEADAAVAGQALRPVLVEAKKRTERGNTEGEDAASGLGPACRGCNAGDGPLPTGQGGLDVFRRRHRLPPTLGVLITNRRNRAG